MSAIATHTKRHPSSCEREYNYNPRSANRTKAIAGTGEACLTYHTVLGVFDDGFSVGRTSFVSHGDEVSVAFAFL